MLATEPVKDPITLFAPTNEAFAKVADLVAGLSPEEVLEVRLPAPTQVVHRGGSQAWYPTSHNLHLHATCLL